MHLFVSNKTHRQVIDTMNMLKSELDKTKVELLTYLQKNNSMFDLTMQIIKQHVPVNEQESYIGKVNTVWNKPELKESVVIVGDKYDHWPLCTYKFTVGTVFDNNIPQVIKELAKDYEFVNIKLTRTKDNPTTDEYMLTCKANGVQFEKFKKDAYKIL